MKPKTWNEIINETGFVPEFLDLAIQHKRIDSNELIRVSGMFFEQRIDKSSVPEGWYAYDIRHSDFDMTHPSTIEKNVVVNYYGTILIDTELPLVDRDYLNILSCSELKSWEEVAEEELAKVNISLDCLDLWDNLTPIKENVEGIKKHING